MFFARYLRKGKAVLMETTIELNDKFKKAYSIIEDTNKSLFITGKAGTGKSTFLKHFCQNTKKNYAIVAPTGVAAVNVGGQTIHSFFKFGLGITIKDVATVVDPSIYQNLQVLIIDEVSMVRADLLDCIDKFLQVNRQSLKPFGGVQMVLIGDLYQLPPVVLKEERKIFYSGIYNTPYFFSANSIEELTEDLEVIEFKKIYRQEDTYFIDLLNKIRNGDRSVDVLNALNERYVPTYRPKNEDLITYIVSTNKKAKEINDRYIDSLEGSPNIFEAEVSGEYRDNYKPTEDYLNIKIGAQVMMINNDSKKRWYNGSIGKVLDVGYHDVFDNSTKEYVEEEGILVELENGCQYWITSYTWEILRHILIRVDDKDSYKFIISTETLGAFKQLPIKICKAITVHKSQGKTFENVFIDTDYGMFAHGQLYVALSRCTTLEGIKLKSRIRASDILIDEIVTAFMKIIREVAL